MKTKVIRIGNSRGIRIPKSLLEESGLTNDVELKVSNNQIIIKTASKTRESWEAAFQRMAKNKDDMLLDSKALPGQSKWDTEEWEW